MAAPDWSVDLVLIRREGSIDASTFGPGFRFVPVRRSEQWHRRLSVVGLSPKIDRLVGRPDAVLGPAFVTWKSDAAEMPVIHDLTYVRHPGFLSPRNLWFMRAVLTRSVKRADVVITVSNAVREELSEHYGIDPERIAVVPNGYDEHLVDAGQGALPDGVPKDFLLFVGTKEPRKNLERTLEAHALARSRSGLLIPPLVIVGGKGWKDERVNAALARAPAESVIQTGYIDDASLFALYRSARALVFPSLYEGFGLPVLEAMANRCPVVTAAVGGVPEVAEDAAIYVDPLDPASIAQGIVDVITDESLRSLLVARGERRAEAYTWIASGARLKAAVERAVSRR